MLERARTQAETIRELVRSGLTAQAIIGRTGFKAQRVRDVICAYRRDGEPKRVLKSRDDRRTFNIAASEEVWRALAEGASQRGISVSRLASRLVRTAAREGLVDAILDDQA